MNNFRRRSLSKFEDYITRSFTYIEYTSDRNAWSLSPTTSACTLVSGKTVKLNSDISFTLPYQKKTYHVDVYASGKRKSTQLSVENKTATGKFLSGNLTFIYDDSQNGGYKITKATPSNLVNFEPFEIYANFSQNVYKIGFSFFTSSDRLSFQGRYFIINVSGSGIPTNVTLAMTDTYFGYKDVEPED